MIGYLYRITNINTGKHYIGITENFKTRQKKHLGDLKRKCHHSPKLQNAWNYWGESSFEWTVREIKIDNYDELYSLEIEEIEKYNSYEDGYNCNRGGKISDWKQKVKDEDAVAFLCFQELKGDGYGKTFEEIFNWAKGTASSLKRKIRYLSAIALYEKLNQDQKLSIINALYEQHDIENIRLKRLQDCPGSQRSYSLTQNDYNFAFAAQELGFGYTEVGEFLEISPATVKDWFNGRSRIKNKSIYNNLSIEEKNKIKNEVENSELFWFKHDKFFTIKEDDIINVLCCLELNEHPPYRTIERAYGWSHGTIKNLKKENSYPISKKKVSLLTELEKDHKAKCVFEQINNSDILV